MLDNEPGAANSPAPGSDAASPPAANPDHSTEPAATAGSAATDAPEATTTRRTRRRATKATAATAGADSSPTAETGPATASAGDASDAGGAGGAAEAAGAVEAGGVAEPVKATRRRRRSAASAGTDAVDTGAASTDAGAETPATSPDGGADSTAGEAPTRTTRSRRRSAKAAPAAEAETTSEVTEAPEAAPAAEIADEAPPPSRRRAAPSTAVLFMPPTEAEVEAEAEAERGSRRRRGRRAEAAEQAAPVAEAEPEVEEAAELDDTTEDEDDETPAGRRRRRRGRRGRGRGKGGYDDDDDGEAEADEDVAAADDGGDADEAAEADDEAEADEGVTRRRRRRRRKGAGDVEAAPDDPANTVVKIREPRAARERDEVQGVSGSTRLEAKRQRRRDGREQRRTRPPILSESEFLARREAVERVMVVRQKGDRTQIAVLEDKILVEHYVARASAATMVGNVYLGRVQNVLPSMEAAFVDIGRGRNAVLYAGEVNWDATGLEGRTRTIEQALKSGDSVLVQVTKDPIGTKGARLTSHVALSGRHLVYVPHGNASGISRKLSDIERKRLRDVLKNLVPEGAGVIVRTAAEGASEDELARDVKRLQAQWEEIHSRSGEGGAPKLLYEEPDLVIRVVRDLFNEDFRELIVQGDDAYGMVEAYLQHVSPDLVGRVHRYTGSGDVFHEMRVDEQILKGLDRRVFLPSGGHLVIDRTEAMTVIDVNTGKYTGAGGNLEETVTRNNLEAAEEIVRQLRLRDLGGIVVIDFIDMVLESNRELVLRRLTECLGRDRTKHQVTEITSLGLVQMTRKRVGQGLLEAFSETCEVCKGRGLIIHPEPVPDKRSGSGSATGAAKVAAASAPATPRTDEPSENGRGSRRRRKAAAAAAEPVAEPAVEPVLEPAGSDGVVAGVAANDDDLDAHEAALAGLDPVPAVGFDEDGLDGEVAEEEPIGARRRGRRRR
jgi:ribonuclease E